MSFPSIPPRLTRPGAGACDVPRTVEGVDIAHLGGEDTVASLVSFIDGLPFKPAIGDSKYGR